MTRTYSSMTLALGTMAPEFSLQDTQGNLVSRNDYVGKVLVVMFICNHCPYVHHIRHALTQFAHDYQPQGVGIVAINANDPERYPADNLEAMQVEVAQTGYPFAYLVDSTQTVAAAYHAVCTPDFFVFDNRHRLIYRGQFDDARPGNTVAITGADLRQAVDAALNRDIPVPEQKPSLGCDIKWRHPHAPDKHLPTNQKYV